MESVKRWDDVSSIETDRVNIRDDQSGKHLIVRQFKYQYRPDLKVRPKAKDLLTKEFIKYLEVVLWGDALEIMPPSKGFPNPRVAIQKRGFTVFVVCQPKRGNMIPSAALEQTHRPLQQRLIEDKEPQ